MPKVSGKPGGQAHKPTEGQVSNSVSLTYGLYDWLVYLGPQKPSLPPQRHAASPST